MSQELADVMEELQFLRDKDAVFQNADTEKDNLKKKIEDLEAEIDRLHSEIENFDFNNKVLRKEVEQYKDDLMNIDENFAKARDEQRLLQE